MVVGFCSWFRLFRLFQSVSSWFRMFQKVFLLRSSRLFSLFRLVLGSVRLLTFLKLSLVVHVLYLDVGSFRSS